MKNVFTLSLFFCLGGISLNAFGQNPFSFTNANSKFVSTNFHSGNAVSVADMNGDGLDDIARLDQSNDLYYTIQRVNETFNNIHAGNAGSTGSAWSMVAGDVDNNGVRDVAVGFGSNTYLMKANTTLTTFTLSAALPKPSSYFPQNMSFADMDNDGFIDLYVCNDIAPSVLYGNSGSGTYPVISNFFSTGNTGSDGSGNYGSIFTDIDNDGDIDLYVAHCRQGTGSTDGRRLDQLFIHQGNNWVLDDAAVPGARGLRNYDMTWTASFDDIDNDGDLDCVLTETDVASKLLLNDGNGYFTNISTGSGFVVDITPYQSKMEDLDNDGFVDIIISGDNARIYHNNHNNTFTRIDNLFNNNNMLSFATGDLNHDGKIDLYSTYGSVYNTPTSTDDVLWLNSTNNGNHFISFNLQGTISNRDALGARVEIYGAWGKQIREVRAGESYGTSNSLQMHFGLGSATMVDSAIIRWPKGLVTTLYNKPADQFITVIEGQCSSPDNVIAFNGPAVLCAGQSVTMTAAAGNYSYLWSTGATTQSISTSVLGEYTVKITDNATGCNSTSKTATIVSQPDETPAISAAGETNFCEGGSVVLNGSAANNYLWSNGDTTQNITVSQPGSYYLTIQGACAPFSSTPVVITNIPSHVSNVTSASACTNVPTALNLAAVATGDAYWYDSPTAGALVTTGTSYSTAPLSNTTVTYYVESRDTVLGVSSYVGAVDSSIGGGSNYNTNQYQIFSVTAACVLKSVRVFSGAAGNRTIELRNSAGTVLQSATVNIPTGAVTVPLNFNLTPGTNYRLGIVGTTINLWRSSSGASYPYTIPNYISVTGNSANDLARWYFFYNWLVETSPTIACASVRVPVTAEVHNTPAGAITPAQSVTICQGQSATLSAEPGWTYLWSNNATTQDITVSASGTFDVTVSDAYCSATASAEVIVSNNGVANVTPSAATTFCQGGSVDLTAAAGTAYLWSNGETTQIITVSGNQTLTVTVTLAGGCDAISNPVDVVVNPLPTVSFIGLSAQYYQIDAPVTLTGNPAGGTFSGTGVSGNTFDPAAAGVGGPYTITYTYTDGNGCEASSTSEVTVLLANGFAAIAGINAVSVTPNPSNGDFNLTLTGSAKIDMAVTNSLGQKVFEEKNITVTNLLVKPVHLKTAAKGIYQLVLSSGKEQSTYRIVVQ